jgi:3-phenylpropionate/cinnamic acid dioxygenase small subunit
MSQDVLREIELFLYREAQLLDDRCFHDWLALFTDDVHYWMAARTNRYPKSSKAIRVLDESRQVEGDLPKPDELAIIDDDKVTLGRRIARLDTGFAWGEDPPSRTRHLITNIIVESGDTATELRVSSNFMVYRNRAETEQEFYVGTRQDILRRIDGTLRIARRRIILDQNVLLVKNVSIFF